MAENTIDNPFEKGQSLVIPAGTPVRSMNPQHKDGRVTKRAQTINVFSAYPGWVDTANDHKRGIGYVILPTITWPGSGGYWQDVQITESVCEANSVNMPALPTLDRYAHRLDVEPSYGAGYDNRRVAA